MSASASPILPVEAILPDLMAVLSEQSSAVLIAPPGAGKTTMVAPALLTQAWCTGKIILLSPRRLAARAAAERMAALAGEAVGQSIGYATRLDSKQSKATRILVVTEGIFVNRIQDDPELPDISAILFDEVHERSLDSDFALALALDVQAALRPDLRLLAMSATLDGGRFSALMDNAPLIESEGKSWPLTLRHVGRRAEAKIESEVARAIALALREEADGDILAFLPGVREIDRTAEALAAIGCGDSPSLRLHKLHGTLEPAEQAQALRPDSQKRRKIILATSIAETSLTIDGVRIVVDSGLARRPRYDRAAGLTRLVTEKASRAAATQRAGRAARQRPGVAYRLWEEAATAGLPAFDPPEILETDLSSLSLACAIWGSGGVEALRWIDIPPKAALDEARHRLTQLDALDAQGRPTAHGKAVARLPLSPRLAHMLLIARDKDWGSIAADVAVLLSERGLGGQDADLELRWQRWQRESGKRAQAAHQLARRWANMAGLCTKAEKPSAADIAACIALAYPDRVARHRNKDSDEWASVGGRSFKLDITSSLAREEWLAIGEVQGVASGARILSAATLPFAMVEELFGSHIHEIRTANFDLTTNSIRAERQRKLGNITLSRGPDSKPDDETCLKAILAVLESEGLDLLPWPAEAMTLRARASFAHAKGLIPVALDDAHLWQHAELWLHPLLAGIRRLSDIKPAKLTQAIENLLDWTMMRALDTYVPAHFQSPAGSQHSIEYLGDGAPSVELRVQALYGLKAHPHVAGIPLLLRLTSPAGRPIQSTRDLPTFWSGSWHDVAKEMRGRYPGILGQKIQRLQHRPCAQKGLTAAIADP